MKVELVNNDLNKQFEILDVIGEGSYGVVARCKRRSNGDIVAIKFVKGNENKINKKRINKKGLRIDCYREIQILKLLYDEECKYDFTNNRITKLQQLLIGSMREDRYNLGLVFEYIEFSLSQIIRYHRKKLNKQKFDQIMIKKMIYQMFEGINILHKNWILHRDLKPSNILISKKNGIVKICDFGLSKIFRRFQTNGIHKQQLDGELVTLYYRSPELFLSDDYKYHESPSIDIWSIGVILAELIIFKPLFKIDLNKIKDNNQRNKELLKMICFVVGIPYSLSSNNNDDNNLYANNIWNGVENLKFYNDYPIDRWKNKYKLRENGCLFERIKSNDEIQKDLIKKLLMMDPMKRLTIQQAMKHPYFKSILEDDKHKNLHLWQEGECPYQF